MRSSLSGKWLDGLAPNSVRQSLPAQTKCALLSSQIKRTRVSCRTVKVRDVLKLLTKDGWYFVTTTGSHRQFKHSTKRGRVTVAGHPSDDLNPKTLNSILTQAELKK